MAITLADDAREAAQAVAAVEAAGGATMSRASSGSGLGTTSRRSTRLAGIAPYKHKINWDVEAGGLVRRLGWLA